MQEDLKNIEKELLQGLSDPHTAADYNVKLSGWYSFLSGKMQSLLERRPSEWNKIRAREDVKSAKSADREYEASEDGLELMRLKMTMDRIEKMQRSLRDLIYVWNKESRNQY